jgi:hypothetical protein
MSSLRAKILSLTAAAVAAAAIGTGAAEAKDLVATGIGGSDDHVYFWYVNNSGVVTEVSAGTTDRPWDYRSFYPFPQTTYGKLVAVDIAPDDRVFYWWEQPNTGIIILTVGTSNDPDRHEVDYNFVEDGDRKLIGAGIAKSSGTVYYYWKHKTTGTVTVTRGSRTVQVSSHQSVNAATTFMSHDLLDVAIAGDDHVYYWWRRKSDGRVTVTAGTSVDPFAYRQEYYSGL